MGHVQPPSASGPYPRRRAKRGRVHHPLQVSIERPDQDTPVPQLMCLPCTFKVRTRRPPSPAFVARRSDRRSDCASRSPTRASRARRRPRLAPGPGADPVAARPWRRVRLQVELPSGFGLTPAVHGEREQVRPVLEVPEHRRPLGTSLAARRVEPERTVRLRRRPPQTDAAAAQRVQGAVDGPGPASEPPRGQIGRWVRPHCQLLAGVQHSPPWRPARQPAAVGRRGLSSGWRTIVSPPNARASATW